MNDNMFYVKELTQWLWEPPKRPRLEDFISSGVLAHPPKENASEARLKRSSDNCEEGND